MTRRHDTGFSLIELLVVIVVLGILAAVVVASVGGFKSEAEDSACDSDAQILATSVEAFFAQRSTNTIPASDLSPDGFERTLEAEGFLRDPSIYYDLNADGNLVLVADPVCFL